MRGRLDDCKPEDVRQGNTPAYAGKTQAKFAILGTEEKHPRVCGEDESPLAHPRVCQETPPRMRGRPALGAGTCRPYGNTPAYAGKTCEYGGKYYRSQKHPRVCGEDSKKN